VSDHAAPPTSDPVLVEVAAGIARVRMHRPERRNALGLDVLTALIEAMADVGSRDDVQVVILGGDGPAFSAGHDIAEMVDGDEAYYRELFSTCTTLMNLLRQLSQPVIAQVDGVATAAGCQLVAGCDLAVASERATFATPGVRIGLFCSTPLVPISRAVGTKRALEMLLTGEPIDAQKALEWGLVNKVVPPQELAAATLGLARKIAEKPPATVAAGKRAFYQQMDLGLAKAYDLASGVISASFAHQEGREGMDAFIDKRPPPKH
jgi:enoyl-CoA hydratase/carnithine racemase